ncbi:unnamed protein product [Tilletia laevis]|uniref:AMP-dependent synthetase/ligase domain-containing protein n=2 Tax=Tilletia TaxID=13289 RepID=A0A177VH84_9BASI|nr:hypothetical protein CF336_g1636 [Tilletia laevis]KAE8264142.1 hypothetical protein A4X03_0g1157 [Tilletia caries]CAD6972485.1 unnamed protein product [Tilletia controversa]KAE8207600.1 hypothetical protein CF335_g1028 [Tilletia laevis]CAD6887216.1 unnamed protein product [Tilletia caries]
MTNTSKIYSSSGPQVDDFPTDLDYYDFFFKYWPATRPDIRTSGIPVLIDEETGISRTIEDLQSRTDALSLGLSRELGLGRTSIVCLCSPNTLDYLPAVLAVHRLGGILAPVNPNLPPQELQQQLRMSKADAILVADAEPTRIQAALRAGIPSERIVLIRHPSAVQEQHGLRAIDGRWTVDGLIDHVQNLIRQEGREALEACRFRLSEDNRTRTAFLSFSSGTSGLPKGVRISHQNPIANVLQHCAHMKIPACLHAGHHHLFEPGQDRALGMLPWFHIYGLVVVLSTSVWAGIGVVCVPRFRGTEALLQTTVRHKVSHWYLVPPIIVKLTKEEAITDQYVGQLGHLKYTVSGAAPLKDDLARAFLLKFPGMRFGQGYGLTETCATVVMSPTSSQDYVFGSAGVLIPNTQARIVRPDGSDAGPDEPGELWVRGPQVSMGYLENEKETSQSYLPGGWFRTGDEVVLQAAGLIFVVDRLKEMIKVKGYQVAPAELEGLLLDSRDVLDVGVVGLPDEESGELPLAFVSLSSSAQERVQRLGRSEEVRIIESLMDLVRSTKIRYKHLGSVVIIPEIPKNPSGKILRKELKKLIPAHLPTMKAMQSSSRQVGTALPTALPSTSQPAIIKSGPRSRL